MTTATITDCVTLYYRQGSSDKEYRASVEPEGGGYVVRFAFGRRGSTLQTGVKTLTPVDYQTARRFYEKLVREKVAKGYALGENGTPYQDAVQQDRATGILPQLLNPINEDQAARLIDDPDWWAQEKLDGKRILIRKADGQITGISRKGMAVALPQPIAEQARTIGGQQWLIDGEAIGDVFVAFDLLEQDDMDLRDDPYSRRLSALTTVLALRDTGAIRLVQTAVDAGQKRTVTAALRRDNREGVVFKRHDAPYTPGRPASGGDQLKLKFTATASCIVARSSRTKRSVALELLDAGHRVGVGNVTIPPNHPIPAAGSVIEARYLYCTCKGGSLYQPVYIGPRDDIDIIACTIAQLKYKPVDDDGDAC